MVNDTGEKGTLRKAHTAISATNRAVSARDAATCFEFRFFFICVLREKVSFPYVIPLK